MSTNARNDEDDLHVLLDEYECIPIMSPVCTYCRHWRLGDDDPPRTCDAFPDGIPMEIWAGLNQHQQPYSGDHGIQFEPEPGAKVRTPQPADPRTIEELRLAGFLPGPADPEV